MFSRHISESWYCSITIGLDIDKRLYSIERPKPDSKKEISPKHHSAKVREMREKQKSGIASSESNFVSESIHCIMYILEESQSITMNLNPASI